MVFYSLVATIPNGGITNFFSLLIESFGYSAEESLLYSTPGGAVEVVTLVVGGYLGDRYGNRILVATFGLICGIVGMSLIVGLPLGESKARLGGYYLTQASAMPFVAFLSLIGTNVAGYTKKTTVAAMYLIGYCKFPYEKQAIEPFAYKLQALAILLAHKSSDQKMLLAMYQLKLRSSFAGCVPIVVSSCKQMSLTLSQGVCLLDMLFIYYFCRLQNKKKARRRAEPDYVKLENQEFLDLTDRENPEFTYTL